MTQTLPQELGNSDHEAVLFSVNQQARVNYTAPRKLYQFRKADMNKLVNRCDDFCQEYAGTVAPIMCSRQLAHAYGWS